MPQHLYICLAPGKLKPGITEADLIKASDKFDAEFVKKQQGIVKRQMLRGENGQFADLVTFASKEAAGKVMEAEQTSPVCHEFFSIFEMPENPDPNMGVICFELIKTYDSSAKE